MKFFSNSVTRVLAYNGKSPFLAVALNTRTYIADFSAGNRNLDRLIKAFSGYVNQPLCLFGNFSAGKCGGVVAVIAVNFCSEVDTYNVALFKDTLFAWNAVNYFIVYGNACCGGKAV